MVKIRLTRKGRKNAPSYRIVVADSRSKRDGKFIEIIGYYNPTEDKEKVVYKKDRYEYWISVGAQPTKAVKKLINGKYEFVPYDPNAKKEEPEEQADEQIEKAEEDSKEQEKVEASEEKAKEKTENENEESNKPKASTDKDKSENNEEK